jgi:uncharacterized protein
MKEKFNNLLRILREMQSALIAYSGGVDSSFLLKALQMSEIKTLAVTASSEIIPHRDILRACEVAGVLGVKHKILKTEETLTEEFISNSPDRCFFCKDMLFSKLDPVALSEGYEFVLDGSNTDDYSDFRPGRNALLKHKVRTPLAEAGLLKAEIRELSRQLGLSTWNGPSSSCLATRIPYGRRITKEALRRIEEAEDFLVSAGFREVRVRDYGDLARIEVGEYEIDLMIDHARRKSISEKLKSLGYAFVSLDMDGYRSGSMNRVL